MRPSEECGHAARRTPATVSDWRTRRNMTMNKQSHGATANQPKILFIAGAGRSGSTILEKLLGEAGGLAPLGEVRHLWERGVKNNQLCGCGRVFGDCQVWRKILNRAFNEERIDDIDLLIQKTSSIERFRHSFYYILRSISPQRFCNDLEFMSETFRSVYQAAAFVFDGNILIDSSKHMHGLVLSEMSGIDLSVVHLVRDSRATVFSWSRSKTYERNGKREITMPKIGWLAAALEWIGDNLIAEYLRLRGERCMRVRYEDFSRDPISTIQRILGFLGKTGDLEFRLSDSRIEFGEQHAVSGNPSRFLRGNAAIKIDDEWQNCMPRLSRYCVTVLTLPLLYRYGYFKKASR